MSERAVPVLSGLLFLSLAAGWLPAAAYEAPQTSWGHPDLEGTYSTATRTTLERPPGVGLVLSEAEAEALRSGIDNLLDAGSEPTDPDEGAPPVGGNTNQGYNTFWIDPGDAYLRINGEIRSSIITYPEDGRMPYKPFTRLKLLQQFVNLARNYDGPEVRPLGERCIVGFGSSGGPPMLPVLYNNNYQIVQTEDHVMILVEMNHDARIIRLDSEHLPAHMRPWLGDSIGWFEGNTLVVETTNFHPGQSLRAAIKHVLYLSADAKVTERFTRTADDEILYQFTIDDPAAYTDVVRGELPMRAHEDRIFEYACHEANYALSGILAGARREERLAKEAASEATLSGGQR